MVDDHCPVSGVSGPPFETVDDPVPPLFDDVFPVNEGSMVEAPDGTVPPLFGDALPLAEGSMVKGSFKALKGLEVVIMELGVVVVGFGVLVATVRQRAKKVEYTILLRHTQKEQFRTQMQYLVPFDLTSHDVT